MRWSTRRSLMASVLAGVLFAAFMAGYFSLIEGQAATRSAISGVFSGIVFGVLFGFLFLRPMLRGQEDDGADELTFRQRRRATKAVAYGPVPTDPIIREAALAAARRRLRWYGGHGTWFSRISVGILLILTVITAIEDDPLFWIATPFWIALLAYAEWERQVLPRRIELLGS